MVNSWVMSGNPCKRDCPDRVPGCYCERKKEFDAQKEERKAIIKESRERDKMLNNYEKNAAIRRCRKRSGS